MSEPFKDHFSGHARDYASHRPTYPDELFDWIATLTDTHDRAFDCATGNGQAAVSLARHYRHVVAADASAGQIESRRLHERVSYLVALAEAIPLSAGCCDLLTVAQAAHWFDFARFDAEVRRVVRPGGAVVVWAYEKFRIEAHIDEVVEHFYSNVVGEYWPPERRHVENGYRDIPFSFAPLTVPPFDLGLRWTLAQTLSYIETWSAVRRYRQALGRDPMLQFAADLESVWPEEETARAVRWPLVIKAGRV
jgi:SAM-dependent methyltransferase